MTGRVPGRAPIWLTVLLLNAALAGLVQAAAPAQPRLSDRNNYEYNAREPLAGFCPNSIYCYRVLVPVLLDQIPIDPEPRWRGYQWLSHVVTGTVLALTISTFASPWLATVLVQSSYAFTFTAYDPYTPDPFIFLLASLTLLCWLRNWPWWPLMIAFGVFAKETVALILAAPAIAAAVLSRDRRRWPMWVAPAALAGGLLLLFHWYMDTYAGWGISRNMASNFSQGSWLAIWWKTNPSLVHKAFMVFSPFGFAWAFAALGYRWAPPRLQQLALGAVVPMLALVYVQTPERALGNAFFVVVPLATVFLSGVPPLVAWAAVISNGLVTAKIGLSTAWLPGSSIVLVPATLAAAWVLWHEWTRPMHLRTIAAND